MRQSLLGNKAFVRALVAPVSPYYVDRTAMFLGLGYKKKEVNAELNIGNTIFAASLRKLDDNGEPLPPLMRIPASVRYRLQLYYPFDELIRRAVDNFNRVVGKENKVTRHVPFLFRNITPPQAAEIMGYKPNTVIQMRKTIYYVTQSNNLENAMFRLAGIPEDEWMRDMSQKGGLSPWVPKSISMPSPWR